MDPEKQDVKACNEYGLLQGQEYGSCEQGGTHEIVVTCRKFHDWLKNIKDSTPRNKSEGQSVSRPKVCGDANDVLQGFCTYFSESLLLTLGTIFQKNNWPAARPATKDSI